MTRTIALALVALFPAAALADYSMPAEAERLLIRAETWQIEGTTLTVTDGADEHQWEVDLLWLADRVCSDAICTGDYEAEAKAHLARVAAATRQVSVCQEMGDMRVRVLEDWPAVLRVELVRVEGREGLFVAGVWVDDGAFERASEVRYCPLIRVHGDAFDELGAEAHAERLQELNEEGWKRIRAAG